MIPFRFGTGHIPCFSRAFTVTYDRDLSDLSRHYDNAETTLNVALNEDYEGGELVFSGHKTEPSFQTEMFG